jgi:hypothetical protein
MAAPLSLHDALVEVFRRERVPPPSDRGDLVRALKAAARMSNEDGLFWLAEDVLWAERPLPRGFTMVGFSVRPKSDVIARTTALLPLVPRGARSEVENALRRFSTASAPR